MEDRIVARGLTFDDVLLEPAYSEVMPNVSNCVGHHSGQSQAGGFLPHSQQNLR